MGVMKQGPSKLWVWGMLEYPLWCNQGHTVGHLDPSHKQFRYMIKNGKFSLTSLGMNGYQADHIGNIICTECVCVFVLSILCNAPSLSIVNNNQILFLNEAGEF
jgi:hypothetical protein